VVTAHQFDVFPNPSAHGKRWRPFLVVIQAEFLANSRTRVVVPLVQKTEIKPIARLNPLIAVENDELYFHPVELAHIPEELLRNRIANLEAHRDKLVAAIDLVFAGI